jgi:hypothetical protein
MATTTPNYGWDVPTSTDYVKDGATAIETLGDDIDASMFTALAGKKAGMVLLNTTTFSAVASQTINSVFSATYDTYMVVFNTTLNSGDADHFIKLRSGVTDLSSTYYGYAASFDVAGVATNWGMNNATTGLKLGEQDNNENGGNAQYILFISAPFVANRSKFTWEGFYASKNGGLNQVQGGGIIYNNTSYDGMNFIASAGTFSGTVSTYGVNK